MIAENDKCRLCFGHLFCKFKLTVLCKYSVQYFICASCGSLQTEYPYWLDEAYSDNALSRLDTGAAQRSINNFAASYIVSSLYKANNVLDFGGGDGLLCRLLRDYEINCFVKDRYAHPTYAQGYVEQDFEFPDLVLGFEVLEHFANPSIELDELFRGGVGALLLSTSIYNNEDEEWWYLAPGSGQHVFFYSKRALEFMASKYGYSLALSGGFIIFAKDKSRFKLNLARLLLSPPIMRFIKAWLITRPARGVWKDYLMSVEGARSKKS